MNYKDLNLHIPFKEQNTRASLEIDIVDNYQLGDQLITLPVGESIAVTAVCNKDPDKPVTKELIIQDTP